MLLDTVEVEGVTMMTARGRDPWLNAAATGLSHRRSVNFERGVRIVREELRTAIVHEQKREELRAKDAAAATRKTLGVDDESSSESSDGCQPKRKVLSLKKPELLKLATIEYRGVRFRACIATRRLYFEVRADVAQMIVEACLDRTATALTELTDRTIKETPTDGCQPKRKNEEEGCPPAEKKKIRYVVSRKTYEVTYTDADRKERRTVKGLTVPSIDGKGRLLPGTVFDEHLKKTHRIARRMWNELDKSGEARLRLD